ADTGIGIPEEDHERIFQEFAQLENPLQQRVKGTGLGLPLSKRLAELLGGAIDASSQPGLGSTFTLTIPLMPPDLGIDTLVADPSRHAILVVDDDDADLLMCERALANT